MSDVRAFALHAASASIMTLAWLRTGVTPQDLIIQREKGGRFQFLTVQVLMGTRVYVGLCLVCDVFPGVRSALGSASSIKKILLMITLPLSFVVSAIYWSLYLFFPTLILRPEPPANGKPTSSTPPKLVRLPLLVDMSLHLVPFLTLFVDFLAFEEKFSHELMDGVAPAALLVYGVSYACWVEYCAKHNGAFPYPFLTRSSLQIRVIIYTCVIALAFTALRLLNFLHP